MRGRLASWARGVQHREGIDAPPTSALLFVDPLVEVHKCPSLLTQCLLCWLSTPHTQAVPTPAAQSVAREVKLWLLSEEKSECRALQPHAACPPDACGHTHNRTMRLLERTDTKTKTGQVAEHQKAQNVETSTLFFMSQQTKPSRKGGR
jgi:hypothetical protein